MFYVPKPVFTYIWLGACWFLTCWHAVVCTYSHQSWTISIITSNNHIPWTLEFSAQFYVYPSGLILIHITLTVLAWCVNSNPSHVTRCNQASVCFITVVWQLMIDWMIDRLIRFGSSTHCQTWAISLQGRWDKTALNKVLSTLVWVPEA